MTLVCSRAECVHDPALALGQHVPICFNWYPWLWAHQSPTSQTLWLVSQRKLRGLACTLYLTVTNSRWVPPEACPAPVAPILMCLLRWTYLIKEDHTYRDAGTLVEWWPSYCYYFQHDSCLSFCEFLISWLFSAIIYQRVSLL